MTKLIRITDELSLPLDIITMRTAEYGDSGSGKTAFARLLAEKVHDAGHRFCAIDLKNDWWGLKSSADGSAAGIPVVIFGGPRADVKLVGDAQAGAVVAETVTSIDQSAVIDLDALSRAKQEKFLTAFLDRLYDVNRRPILLFCDEADRYAPQKPMTQDAIMALSSSEDIARRGRKRGIGSVWLAQRTAVLNKNVSEFSNLVVVFRTPGSKDLKELEERVGRIASKETVAQVVRQAPALEDGQAFFLSAHPKLRQYLPSPVRPVQLPMPSTFDSSATPSVGQRRREPKVLAQADLAAIESKMAEQVQRSRDEDPKLLKAEVARLRLELTRAQNRPAPPPAKVPEPKRVEVPVLKDGQLDRADKLIGRLADLFTKAGELQQQVKAATDEVAAAMRKVVQPAPALAGPRVAVPSSRGPVATRPQGSSPPVVPQSGKVSAVASSPDAGGRLPDGERKILTAAAQYPAGVARDQLTVLTGYKRSSRDTYVQRLRQRGYVDLAGDAIVATDKGIAALGDSFEPLPTGPELMAYWLDRLPEGERKVIESVAARYPEPVDREVISDETGYKRSSRDTYLQRLRSRRLVDDAGRGMVRASENLF